MRCCALYSNDCQPVRRNSACDYLRTKATLWPLRAEKRSTMNGSSPGLRFPFLHSSRHCHLQGVSLRSAGVLLEPPDILIVGHRSNTHDGVLSVCIRVHPWLDSFPVASFYVFAPIFL